MKKSYSHVSQEDLLLYADGELPRKAEENVREHLTSCWECRSRLHQLEQTISDFVRLHHEELDGRLPPAEGSRALLAARLSQLATSSSRPRWAFPLHHWLTWEAIGYAAMVFLFAALGTAVLYRSLSSNPHQTITQGVPDRRLTPGAVRTISLNEVCSNNYSDDAQLLPASVQKKVLKEYGVESAQSRDYQLDYLITPQLGGTDDVRNLWPEPQFSTQWNVQAKDDLEARLHQLVCQGVIDLSTAQSALAGDWVSSYKRYFHTARPAKPI